MKSLSVLITYHNEKELLTTCLRSLKEQKYPPEEILIYDDASTFPPQDFLIPDLSIRVIRGEKNRGPAYGRNLLLKEAKGEFVHFHDCDDWFFRCWSERVRALIEKDSVDAIYTEVTSYKNGEVLSEKVLGLLEIGNGMGLVSFCIRNYMLVPAGTFRTSLARKIGGYKETLWQSEDFDFNIRLAAELIQYELILEPLVGIQIRAESRSQNRLETCTDALSSVLSLAGELSIEHHVDLAKKAADLGSELFRLGDRKKAREAFLFASKMGQVVYFKDRRLYGFVVKYLGQEFAEWMSLLYQKLLPERIRRLTH